jgi:hypothetical protein
MNGRWSGSWAWSERWHNDRRGPAATARLGACTLALGAGHWPGGPQADLGSGPVLLKWVGPKSMIQTSFPLFQTKLSLKNAKANLNFLQQFPNFGRRYLNSKGTTFFLGRSSNSQQNLN